MTIPTYDDLLHYTHALNDTLDKLLASVATSIPEEDVVPMVLAVTQNLTLAVRAGLPASYATDVQDKIQTLRQCIPGVQHD